MSQRTIPAYFKGSRKRPPSEKRTRAGEAYEKQHRGVESVSGGVSVRVDADGDGKHDVEISPIMRDSFEMEDEEPRQVLFGSAPLAVAAPSRAVSVPSNVATGSMWVRRTRSRYRRPYSVYARPRGTYRVRRYRTKFLRRPKA